MELPKLIAVVGTNASGKSSVGIDLAKRFNGEIISADSRQVFRGFDLCSGKITGEESESVPHHLINIRDIGEQFSVADYQELVYSLIPQIHERGRIPFIVGGTGLYINSVVRGYILNMDTPNHELRKELEELPIEELHEKLNREARAFLALKPSDYQNKRRVIRILEKISLGEPIEYNNAPQYDVLEMGLTWPKDALHKRIDERLAVRIQLGMLDEVKEFLNNGGNPDYLFNLGLEYRYILWYLGGKYASFDEFITEISKAIKKFAKKQLTWFRKNKSIIWLETNNDYIGQACELIGKFLKK
jgi:tRNA dimethylallyltransferase